MIKNRIAIVSLLTGLNFLNYLDRFIVAAVLPEIQKDLQLSNFEGGLLATVFLLGYFVTSPLFGILGDRMSRKRLIAFGVFTWSVATFASGIAGNLYWLLVARAFVGIGEASYATLAPTIIDDVSPPDKKGKMLAIFFLATPVGSALGYLLGGMIQKEYGWHVAFFVGGAPGVLLAFTVLWIHEPVRHKLNEAKESVASSIRTLMRIPIYARAVWGYCAHTAAIGAFAFWGPKFLSERFLPHFADVAVLTADAAQRASLAKANFIFGSVTVVAGALGTILGGWMCDRALRGLPPVPEGADHTHVANRMQANAQLKVCAIGVAIAFPATAAAFLSPSPFFFFLFAGIGEVGLFLSTAPINAILLRSAPAWMRASAMAVAIFAIHLFGDLWSPSLIGLFLDYLVATAAMMSLPLMFGLAAVLWWPRAREAR
ncbi:MAG: spinster family MFS transporter [Kofleriaceae bacterium]